jgi:hypothetical protein
MYENKDVSKFAFPDDAQEHFEEIYKRTAGHRNGPVHEYASYEGPWIENQFISKYHNRSLHTFGGLIPIFVQWIDFQILRGRHFDHIYNELTDILRPNVLYVTITQGDVGLGKIGMRHPNILALSAGGFGHVPLPLIKGEIAASAPPEKFEQDIGFFGTTRQATRPEMLAVIKATADELSLTFKQGSGALCLNNATNHLTMSMQAPVGSTTWSSPSSTWPRVAMADPPSDSQSECYCHVCSKCGTIKCDYPFNCDH